MGGSESAEGGIYTGARRALTSPAQRYYITTLGRKALNLSGRRSRSRTEPWQPRAIRPGGCLNPRARKGASTYGNTVSRSECHSYSLYTNPLWVSVL